MKNLILIMLCMIIISCGTKTNNDVSNNEKDKIKGEVKEVVNTFIKGCEENNFDMAIESFLDSPDFVDLTNGRTFSYKELLATKPNFNSLLNQKCTIVDEKYTFLDKSTVLYTADSKWLLNYKDGHSSISDPEAFILMFKKIDKRWRVIYFVDSFVEKNVPSESSKGLDQVELFKQFIGVWKADVGKDTTFIWEGKSYGDGLDVYVKTETKGKIIKEGKAIISYDKKSDKCVQARNMKGSGSMVGIMWFTSKNICEAIYLQDISNTENAASKWKFEFKSLDLLLQTVTENGKLISTTTFNKERM